MEAIDLPGGDLLGPPSESPWWCDRERGNHWENKTKRDFWKRGLEPGSSPVMPLVSCVTLSYLLNLSVPPFTHLKGSQ